MSISRQQTTVTETDVSIRATGENLTHLRVIAEKNLCDDCLGQLFVDTEPVDEPSVRCEDCGQRFV